MEERGRRERWWCGGGEIGRREEMENRGERGRRWWRGREDRKERGWGENVCVCVCVCVCVLRIRDVGGKLQIEREFGYVYSVDEVIICW